MTDVMEIVWNGGYYQKGGTIIHNGEVNKIKRIGFFVEQQTQSIFDRKQFLSIETSDGKVIEIEKR